ncbi:hypothetical protein [Streptomyces sp. SBT349]|uniref:hypothetical protein n=1 Tax=Streptomyces sp. SBT349 TaxID=1580539 RepID=UPI00099C2E43|nr:hypothetical protein [Streptomyces sp. SBT349]
MAETDEQQRDEHPPSPAAAPESAPTSREGRRLMKRIRSFAAAHGGSAEGQISYLGARGHRLVLVGADGGWGDVVSRDLETLRLAAERSGVALAETLDGELAARMRTGPYEWTRMAGMQLGGEERDPVYRSRR